MRNSVDMAVNWMGGFDVVVGALIGVCCNGAHCQQLLNLGWRRIGVIGMCLAAWGPRRRMFTALLGWGVALVLAGRDGALDQQPGLRAWFHALLVRQMGYCTF